MTPSPATPAADPRTLYATGLRYAARRAELTGGRTQAAPWPAVAVVAGVKNLQALFDNPTEFATIAADVIRAKLEEQLVSGIRYEPDGEWYKQEQFAEVFET